MLNSLTKRFSDPPVKIFLSSRIALMIVAFLGMVYIPHPKSMEGVKGPLNSFPQNYLIDPWVKWDSNWYVDIAQNGYSTIPQVGEQCNTAFFPLYPLLIKVVAFVVRDYNIAGLILSNLFFLLALVYLYKLIVRKFDQTIAVRSISLLAFFPYSFYFSSIYTEPLFLLLSVLAFYFADLKKWRHAALYAGLASVTRPTGLAVVLALLIYHFEQSKPVRLKNLGFIIIAIFPFCLFLLYQDLKFGDPLLFLKSQYATGWGNSEGVGVFFRRLINFPSPADLLMGKFDLFGLRSTLVGLFGLIMALAYGRRKPYSYLIFTLLLLFIPIFTISKSMGRTVNATFPLFIYFSYALKKEWVYEVVMGVMTMMLALFMVLFSHWHWVAG